MAKIDVVCPKCQTSYRFDETFEGRKGRCKKCGQVFVATRRAADGSTSAPKLSAPEKPAVERELGEDGVPKVWRPGDVILDLYEITGILGEGGMGTVFKARHKGWNRDLAVKSPKPEIFTTKGGVDNFVREAETWIDLGLHPHTVSCFYVRTLGGIPRVFAEYVEGGSLKDWIEDGRLYEGGPDKALERILDIAIQFAWGLHYAHEKGLIHQDVKPANVMMTPDGIAKVTDFGLAKARATAGEATAQNQQQSILVSSGGMTPAYCSPEQANKESLSRKTDSWSWAVSVLEMFTGEVTWLSGSVAAEALESHLEINVGNDSLPAMPESAAQLLRHCLQQEPNGRPQDMLAVAEALRAVYQQVVGSEYPRELSSAVESLAASLNNRAVSLVDLGKSEEAERVWAEALKADSQHPESKYNFGLVRWRTGRMKEQELVRQLSELNALHREQWIATYLLARVELERRNCKSALALLEGIDDAGPRQPEVETALGLARRYSDTGQCLQTFEGHTGYVACVCLSADGRKALSGSEDKTLKLWDVSSGRCLRTFMGHSGAVFSVCLSSDGHYALSGSEDQTLKLWDVSSGHCLRTFRGHSRDVESVCLSTDGRQALSGSSDQTLKLWELSSGRCLRTFGGHSGAACSVCLSSDGHYALSGSEDQTLKLWDVSSGHCLRTFQGHSLDVESVCLSADGRQALSGSQDRTLKLWQVSSGHCLRTFEGHASYVDSVCLSADGYYALSGGYDDTLKLWEVCSGRCLGTFGGHSDTVYSACLSVGGRYALSGSRDETIKLWDCGKPSLVKELLAPLELSVMEGMAEVHSTSTRFREYLRKADEALATQDFTRCAAHLRRARSQTGYSRHFEAIARWVKLCSCLPRRGLAAGRGAVPLEGHTDEVSSVHLSADGRFALSGSCDQTLRLWDLGSRRCLQTLVGHSAPVNSVCLSIDGRHALSGSYYDQTLRLWELAAGHCLRAFEGHAGYMAVSADGRYALSGRQDQTLELWELSSCRCLRRFEGYPACMALSIDGQYALSAEGKTLRLWELFSGRCLRTFEGHSAYVASACLSIDGRYALSGSGDNTLKLWELSSGRCLQTLEGHSWSVESVCLSADGCYALSGSHDKTLKLWEVYSGRCLHTFEGHTDYVNSVCLSVDGCYALSGSYDKMVRLWFLDWDLEERDLTDWDEGARPWLEVFLIQQTPYAAELPQDRDPTKAELQLTLTRRGKPRITDADFQRLLHTLGCAGYGWLRPEGVRRKLEEMAADWKGPPALPGKE